MLTWYPSGTDTRSSLFLATAEKPSCKPLAREPLATFDAARAAPPSSTPVVMPMAPLSATRRLSRTASTSLRCGLPDRLTDSLSKSGVDGDMVTACDRFHGNDTAPPDTGLLVRMGCD